MTAANKPVLRQEKVPSLQDVRVSLRALEQRDWKLWVTTFSLLLLLCATVAAMVVAIAWEETDSSFELRMELAVRGLVALVLLFSVYTVYQQVLIKSLRGRLTEQIGLAAILGQRAEKFERLAFLDPLTGLLNRRFVMDQLQLEIERSSRQGHSLIALMLEVEGLKSISDQYGYGTADQALITFAQRLRKAIRSSDSPARLDGEKFLVLLPECHQELVPRALARVNGLEADLDGGKVAVRFSAGWVSYQPEESPEQLFRRADVALQRNRHSAEVEEQIRQAKADLRQVQKMEAMGRLAGGVAHDFNNLLAVIRGYAELLRDRLQDGTRQRQMAEETLKAADRAIALTRQLLAFSRQQELQPRVIDLNGLLRDMETMLRRLVGEHVELSTILEGNLARIKADPTHLEQITMNLTANARDAMPNGGRLTFRTANVELDQAFVRKNRGARPGLYVQLSVSDSGEGMDQGTRERIFEPFFTTKEKGRGTGLGLASVYGAIKQSGGYITVESEPGAGSTFTIYFPQAAEEIRPSTHPQQAAQAS